MVNTYLFCRNRYNTRLRWSCREPRSYLVTLSLDILGRKSEVWIQLRKYGCWRIIESSWTRTWESRSTDSESSRRCLGTHLLSDRVDEFEPNLPKVTFFGDSFSNLNHDSMIHVSSFGSLGDMGGLTTTWHHK